jgi:hypothetical protein
MKVNYVSQADSFAHRIDTGQAPSVLKENLILGDSMRVAPRPHSLALRQSLLKHARFV